MEKDHFPSTLELRQIGMVVDALLRLGQTPPPLPAWPQFTESGRFITQDEVDAGKVFWRGEAYRFELLDGHHAVTEMPFEYGWRLETFDMTALPHDRRLWSLQDQPDLVLRVAQLGGVRSGDRLDEAEVLGFLTTYGPLAWSLLVGPIDRDPDLLIASGELARHVDPDPRAGMWSFQFSRPVELVRTAVATLTRASVSAVDHCLNAVDETPRGSLLRGLLRQALDMAIANERPRPCHGCGRLFVRTDTPSEARDGQGWKRTDAQYHSVKCRKAYLERERRTRKRLSRGPS